MKVRHVLLMVALSLVVFAMLAACAPAPTPAPTAAPPTAAPKPTDVPKPTVASSSSAASSVASSSVASSSAPAPTAAPTAVPPTAAPVAGDPYKVGFVSSVTGPVSSLGIPERDTALMLQEQINKAGGIKGADGKMHQLVIITEDDASDASKATLAAKKLVEQDKVAVLIGSSGSPASIAMADYATANSIPLISMASASTIVTGADGKEKKWVFKTPQSNIPVTQVQADYLKAKGITKVASVGVNNAFGQDSRAAMKAIFPGTGIEILADELFQPGDKDFTAQLTKIKGLNPQALVIHATSAEGATLTVQAKQLGFTVPIVHNHGIGNVDFINLAKEASEGILFPIGKLLTYKELPDSDPQKAILAKYVADYTAFTKGAPISTFGGHGWDAVMIAVKALGDVGSDPAKLQAFFEGGGVKNFVGVTGIFTWTSSDHTGVAKESMVLNEIKKGTWVYVAPADYKNMPDVK
ncbi:MAG: ABC transporter substrate-binding protein [Chloroflexi bacterium]|nr:ABC transporter substrate-binding protein [Chloroflexota bacterium]